MTNKHMHKPPAPLKTSSRTDHASGFTIVHTEKAHPVSALFARLLGYEDVGLSAMGKGKCVSGLYQPLPQRPERFRAEFDPYTDANAAVAVAAYMGLRVDFHQGWGADGSIEIQGAFGESGPTENPPGLLRNRAPMNFCKCVMHYAEMWAELHHGVLLADVDKIVLI